ncbi:hypothetical protein U1Q18_021205 [Sarracenia purpurea var. burkii]
MGSLGVEGYMFGLFAGISYGKSISRRVCHKSKSIVAPILLHAAAQSLRLAWVQCPQENTGGLSDVDRLKLLIQNLDLSYRLEWVGDRNVLLTRHGDKLGTFQL